MEKKGLLFGRQGVWNKLGSSKNENLQSLAKNARYLMIKNSDDIKFIIYSRAFFRQSLELNNVLNKLVLPALRSLEQPDLSDSTFAFTYYLDYISPIFSPVKPTGGQKAATIQNLMVMVEPGLDVSDLIKYSQPYEHIFSMMLAVGAIYLLKLEGTSIDWASKALVFRARGLNQFKQLDVEKTQVFSTNDLLLLLLLMLFELANDCNLRWDNYLGFCRAMLYSGKFKVPASGPERALYCFAIELLYYQETMGRTACKAKNTFDVPVVESANTLPSSLGLQPVLVSWMGCDRKVVEVISDITDLSFKRFLSIDESSYMRQCHAMIGQLKELQLDLFKQKPLQALSTVREPDSEEVFAYLVACEAKRLAALMYLNCCLLNMEPEDIEIRALVDTAFKYLAFILLDHDCKWALTLIWTVFMASAEIDNQIPECEELRRLALSILDRIERRSLGNANITRDLVEEIWKARDLSPHSTSKKVTPMPLLGVKNDWETFVANESYKVSLA